jgi:hypothetical protein
VPQTRLVEEKYMKHMKTILFVVLLVTSSFSARAAQIRTSTGDGKSAVVKDDQVRGPRGVEIASPTVGIVDGGFTADYLMHLDPWSALSGNSSYKNCVKETNEQTCYQRCTCGFNENWKKCDGKLLCQQTAMLEKESCDGHCLTDFWRSGTACS